MNKLLLPSLACALLLQAGCASMTVNSDRADGVDFTAYGSFAMAPPPSETAGLTGYSEIHGERIQNAIQEALIANGYELKDRDEADLLVAFGLSGKPRTDVWSQAPIAGPGWYGSGAMVQSVHYVVGTLTIDVFDVEDRKLVWHGWAQKEFFDDQADKGEAIGAAHAIVGNFPKRTAPAE